MERLDFLFEKYRNDKCSPEEMEELLSYFPHDRDEDRLKALIGNALERETTADAELQTATDEVYEKLLTHMRQDQFFMKRRVLRIRWAVAASILLLLGIGGYWALFHAAKPEPNIALLKPGSFKNDRLPGNNAYLTLDNGQQLAVGNLPAGRILTQTQASVQKTAGGAIVYMPVTKGDAIVEYNSLIVPRGGGKHELQLSDGTLAVLDAGSSIRFPVAFVGKDRRVEITGQVYFEVVHNAAQSFYVRAGGQTIEDVGTKFNVNAFDGEIRTTLIEGSVKVNSIVLKPGQQSVQKGEGGLSVIDQIDEEEVLSWKNDLFMFGKNTSLQTVMNQLSRWYDMDIVYEGQVKTRHFGGDMPRYSKLSDVLKILAYSGVQFSVDGKKIIVYQ